jgi:hypothetical protein
MDSRNLTGHCVGLPVSEGAAVTAPPTAPRSAHCGPLHPHPCPPPPTPRLHRLPPRVQRSTPHPPTQLGPYNVSPEGEYENSVVWVNGDMHDQLLIYFHETMHNLYLGHAAKVRREGEGGKVHGVQSGVHSLESSGALGQGARGREGARWWAGSFVRAHTAARPPAVRPFSPTHAGC